MTGACMQAGHANKSPARGSSAEIKPNPHASGGEFSPEIIQHARQHLPCVNPAMQGTLLSLKETEALGNVHNYAQAPDGTELSQREFAARYLQAVRKISTLAAEILSKGDSFEKLAEERNSLLKDLPVATGAKEHIQERYESSIRTELVRLSTCDRSDPELRFRALSLALLAAGDAAREVKIEKLLAGGGAEKLAEYREMMNEARKNAGPAGDINEVLYQYLSLVSARHGYFPQLKVFSHFEGSLAATQDAGVACRTGESTSRLLNEIAKLTGLPPQLRLVTSECAGLDPERRALAQQLHSASAQSAKLFFDAPVLFRQLEAEGIEHHVSTSNPRQVAEEKLRRSRLACSSLNGPSEIQSFISQADLVLLDMLQTKHHAVYFVAANSDAATVDHIKAGPEGSQSRLGVAQAWLPGVAFLSCRKDGDQQTIDTMMAGQGIKIAADAKTGAGKGLEATNSFVRTYNTLSPRNWALGSELAMLPDYQGGQVVADMRERVDREIEMPKPVYRTVVLPIQDRDKVLSPEGNLQYDIGVATAMFDEKSGKWLMLYKSADGPSGWDKHEAVSNVFAASYDSATGEVNFFDGKRPSAPQGEIRPFLTSSLPPKYSRDGLHDPRITWIPELNDGKGAAVILRQRDVIKEKVSKVIKDNRIEVLVPNNLMSVGYHLPALMALSEIMQETGLPTISHNHDFYFEDSGEIHPTCSVAQRILDTCVPPLFKNVQNLVINRLAQQALAKRKGVSATVVPNVFDFNQPAWKIDEYNSDFRAGLGIGKNDLVFLQATRVMNRKGVELAIDVVAELNKPENRKLLSSKPLYDGRSFSSADKIVLLCAGHIEEFGATGDYHQSLIKRAEAQKVDIRFVGERIRHSRGADAKGKIYSLWDSYAHADFVTYPSLWEGWGNQFIEAIFARLPVLLFEYPVFTSDLKTDGFQVVSLGGKITGKDALNLAAIDPQIVKKAAAEVIALLVDKARRTGVVENNYAVAREKYSYEVLGRIIAGLLKNAGIA